MGKGRTDIHRPGAIIPANYEQWNDYSLAGSDGVPAMGLDCAQPIPVFTSSIDGARGVERYEHPVCPDTGRCCVRSTERHARAEGRAIFGHAGKCGVCGAHFRNGSMFRHEATGEIVHMGHDCAQKYEMMVDLSAFELAKGRLERAHATAIARAANDRARKAFLDKHEGLASAFELATAIPSDRPLTSGERILVDLQGRFMRFHELSDKQVALALKLANEIRNPVVRPEELHVAAPLGKGVEFIGEIVSAKLHESAYGAAWKITVKVTTDTGATWLAWGTVPRALSEHVVECVEMQERARIDAWVAEATARSERGLDPGSRQREDRGNNFRRALVGLRVACKATLERPQPRDGKEPESHFVFMSRPTIMPDTYGPVRAPAKRARKAKAPTECDVCGAPEGLPHLRPCA